MSAIAIIPARSGSRRIPGKNKRIFHGKPIIAYSIETAKASGLFDRIIVSTDDDEIAQIAIKYAAVPVLRSPAFCEDSVGTQDVMNYVLSVQVSQDYEYACCIYPTAPLMLPEHLRSGLNVLTESGLDYVYSVGGEPLTDAGQWYWGHFWNFVEGTPLEGERTGRLVIAKDRVCDINTEDDWKRAEKMYAALQENV